jgi:hypothetical protein
MDNTSNGHRASARNVCLNGRNVTPLLAGKIADRVNFFTNDDGGTPAVP